MMTPSKTPSQPSSLDSSVEMAFERFTREEWAVLGPGTPQDVAPAEIAKLVATGEPVSPAEVTDVYLPLAELLTLMAESKRRADAHLDSFLGSGRSSQPFIIGIAGGVAVGKSTTARILQALLRRCAGHQNVDLLTTDGFLHPNATLVSRGLMERKGFPESYDQRKLIEALAAIRSGSPR